MKIESLWKYNLFNGPGQLIWDNIVNQIWFQAAALCYILLQSKLLQLPGKPLEEKAKGVSMLSQNH